MLKTLLVVAVLAVTIFANDTLEEKLELCEQNYNICSQKCEENTDVDFTECVSLCEKEYYSCQTKIEDSLEEESSKQ